MLNIRSRHTPALAALEQLRESQLIAQEMLRRRRAAQPPGGVLDIGDHDYQVSSSDDSDGTGVQSSSSVGSSSSDEDNARKSRKGRVADSKSKSRRGTVQAALDVSVLQKLLGSSAITRPKTAENPASLDEVVLSPAPASGPTASIAATGTATVSAADVAQQVIEILQKQARKQEKPPAKSGSKIAFKRVDQIYDRRIHNYKLKGTVQGDEKLDIWDQYIFNIRRQFDSTSRYLATYVDIKSNILKECLKEVMGDIRGLNLIAEKPAVDPNMLFLYLEELRALSKHHKAQSETLNDKKQKKHAKLVHQHLKMLIKYLDEDYAETKKTLYPMLEAGLITFEYMWALFKPNTICYTTTYGDESESRAFKVVFSKESKSFMKGTWYGVEGRYLEYDGKQFGMAAMAVEVAQFSGARKINSLTCYPIQYHQNAEKARAQLVERGKKFVAMQGMNYKTYSGMAYIKKEETKLLKVDVNGRIMVDPAIFRRVNPNYPLTDIRHQDGDPHHDFRLPLHDNSTVSSDGPGLPTPLSEDFEKQKQFKVVQNEEGNMNAVEVNADDMQQSHSPDDEKLSKSTTTIFSEEQLLTASPVVIGFSFSEKLWLEFAVSRIGEVQWNDGAFDSLILPDNQKSIVKALVSSHAFHPSQSIDDIIAGKGKGLVAVLHGGPGLGKTLTVESIADLLKRPLYMVSAGDLGTNSSTLEHELQTILDIAHSWGAVLLLDEADVFLEKRSTHDIHRNALVSIFLRLLEYFQGILFLTTNRVEVFDDAFISRIHLSLRYGDLSQKAKKAVWKTFIQRVRDIEGMEVEQILEKDLDDLSRRALNGRQIKNIVRAAQALAIHEEASLKMSHIRTVLDVAQAFERDLKGGTGYEDAMRGYN